MIYVVNCDLPRGIFGPSPQPFYDELQSSRNWWHYMANTWLISTPESLAEIDVRLRQHIKDTDKLLIIPFSDQYAGWLPREAWDWIIDEIQKGGLYT